MSAGQVWPRARIREIVLPLVAVGASGSRERAQAANGWPTPAGCTAQVEPEASVYALRPRWAPIAFRITPLSTTSAVRWGGAGLAGHTVPGLSRSVGLSSQRAFDSVMAGTLTSPVRTDNLTP
jgi:hypothetical protein